MKHCTVPITISPTVGLSPKERLEATVCREKEGNLQAGDGYGGSRTLCSEGWKAEVEGRGGEEEGMVPTDGCATCEEITGLVRRGGELGAGGRGTSFAAGAVVVVVVLVAIVGVGCTCWSGGVACCNGCAAVGGWDGGMVDVFMAVVVVRGEDCAFENGMVACLCLLLWMMLSLRLYEEEGVGRCLLAVCGMSVAAKLLAKGMVEYGALPISCVVVHVGSAAARWDRMAFGTFGVVERGKVRKVVVKVQLSSGEGDSAFGSVFSALIKIFGGEVGKGSVGLDGDRSGMVERIHAPEFVLKLGTDIDPARCLQWDEGCIGGHLEVIGSAGCGSAGYGLGSELLSLSNPLDVPIHFCLGEVHLFGNFEFVLAGFVIATYFPSGGNVCGRTVVVYEMTELRDVMLDRDFGFVSADTRFNYRSYEVDANGTLVLRMEMGLGYVGDDLRDVAVYVTKVHDDVPNRAGGGGDDLVEKIVRMLLSCVANEHDGRMAGIAEWEAHLDAPLEARPYLHGELRYDM
ncbi:hypothetical protein CBR_g49441 [Chara braunii]|uniref:Uncharacterized protein n=1 Tax=Chara braunii TaxID=69332 RepID=A0A388M593_CHABU|nr:hypothetical protein CBR_g49441 [Chara braunii]|eukprot:GBG89653.1 hypothetical protein CBR_g49441 [Chara braunii]